MYARIAAKEKEIALAQMSEKDRAKPAEIQDKMMHVDMNLYVISTLVAIKTEPLSDAEFVPPKNFTEMKLPNIKISGDNPEPKPSAKVP